MTFQTHTAEIEFGTLSDTTGPSTVEPEIRTPKAICLVDEMAHRAFQTHIQKMHIRNT